MKIDRLKLEREIMLLIRKLYKVSSFSSYDKIYTDLQNLFEVYESVVDKRLNLCVPDDNYFTPYIIRLDKKIDEYHLNDYLDNNDEYLKITNNVIDIFNKTGFIDYGIFGSQRISYKDFIEIIRMFLNSYNPLFDKMFMNMIENKNIHFYEGKTFSTDVTYYITDLKKSYIVVDKNMSVEGMSTLIHEFVHSYINTIFDTLSPKQRTNTEKTSFIEIYSMYIEFVFCSYLIENKIKEKDTQFTINQRYKMIYECFLKLAQMLIIPTSDEIYDEDELDIISNDMLYGYGSLISLELFDKYEQDPEKVKSNLRSFISSLGLLPKDELLKKLEIDKKEMHTCKTLEKKLIKHNQDIRQANGIFL